MPNQQTQTTTIQTVDDYINSQPEKVREILRSVRKALVEALPLAKEKIAYGMPTYWQEHNLIHFAANANHLGVYPGPQAIVEFKQKLIGYKTSKGAIQIPYEMEIPLDLIVELAQWNEQVLATKSP